MMVIRNEMLKDSTFKLVSNSYSVSLFDIQKINYDFLDLEDSFCESLTLKLLIEMRVTEIFNNVTYECRYFKLHKTYHFEMKTEERTFCNKF